MRCRINDRLLVDRAYLTKIDIFYSYSQMFDYQQKNKNILDIAFQIRLANLELLPHRLTLSKCEDFQNAKVSICISCLSPSGKRFKITKF